MIDIEAWIVLSLKSNITKRC